MSSREVLATDKAGYTDIRSHNDVQGRQELASPFEDVKKISSQ